MKKGVRQGCPVSALLFTLAIEYMSINIRQNEKISGIKINDTECKILQYADDSTLMLENCSSIIESLKTLQKFSCVSGLKLNIDKCQGLWLGRLKQNTAIFENITFGKGPIKCLGVYIGTEFKKCEQENWEKKLTAIEQILIKWSSRKLTLYGKVTVINSLVIPKLLYCISLLSVPQYVIDKIEKLIFQYLWGKTDKIKRKTVIGTTSQGGLNITDIKLKICAVKVSWINKLLSTNHVISQMIAHYSAQIGLDFRSLVKMNFQSTKSFMGIHVFPKFYQEILVYYNNCKVLTPVLQLKSHEVLTQVIWGNEYFQFNGKTLYLKCWIKSGFIFVKDLLDKDGSWINEVDILKQLKPACNWIAELSSIKKALNPILSKIDTQTVNYIQKQLLEKITFRNHDLSLNLEPLKAKYIYRLLVEKKHQRSYTEKLWEKILKIKIYETQWDGIYNSNFKYVRYKKFSEFRYKLLMDILPCGEKLKK